MTVGAEQLTFGDFGPYAFDAPAKDPHVPERGSFLRSVLVVEVEGIRAVETATSTLRFERQNQRADLGLLTPVASVVSIRVLVIRLAVQNALAGFAVLLKTIRLCAVLVKLTFWFQLFALLADFQWIRI